MLMGKRLPPYSQSKARASAWGNATRRYVYHKYEHESMAEELAAAREVCARVPLQLALAARDAARHQRRREGAEKGQLRRLRLVDRSSSVLSPWECCCGPRDAHYTAGRVRRALRALRRTVIQYVKLETTV